MLRVLNLYPNHLAHPFHPPTLLCRAVRAVLQVWRVPEDPVLYDMLRPSFDQLPASYRASVCYHLGIHPLHPPLKLLARLRDAAHAHGGE